MYVHNAHIPKKKWYSLELLVMMMITKMFWYYSDKPLSAFCWKRFLQNNIFHFHSNYNEMPLWSYANATTQVVNFTISGLSTLHPETFPTFLVDCQIVSQPNKQFIFSLRRHAAVTLLDTVDNHHIIIRKYQFVCIQSQLQIGIYV